jgi:tetratricopeptide (TPR) repeat protein
MLASQAQLESAIRFDPKFADALGALAFNRQLSVVLGWSPREAGVAASRELVNKAAALSADGAAAEAALAGHLAFLEEDFTAAERHFQRALAANPNDAATRAEYAVASLLPLGRAEEARREARRADEVDPSNRLAAYALALTDYCDRDFPAAIHDALDALRRQSDSVLVPLVLIDSFVLTGRFDDAWFFVEKDGADSDYWRALIRARKGEKSGALQLARQKAAGNAPPMTIARLFATGGDAPSALHWLAEAKRRHDFSFQIYARYAPEFDGLRSSREYSELMAAIPGQRHP